MGLGGLFQKRKDTKAAKQGIAVQAEQLKLIKEQFKLFQPLFQQFSNFFTDVSVEEIASGKLLSPSAVASISDVNRETKSQLSRLDQNLNARGIEDSSAGEVIRQDLLSRAGDAKVGIRASSRDQELQNRLNFLNFGQATLGARQAAADSSASGFRFLSALQRDKDFQKSESKGEVTERVISLLTDAFTGGTTGFTGGGGSLSAGNFTGGK